MSAEAVEKSTAAVGEPDLRIGKTFAQTSRCRHFIAVYFIFACLDVDGDELVLAVCGEAVTKLLEQRDAAASELGLAVATLYGRHLRSPRQTLVAMPNRCCPRQRSLFPSRLHCNKRRLWQPPQCQDRRSVAVGLSAACRPTQALRSGASGYVTATHL